MLPDRMPIFTKTLRDQRRAISAWTIGIAAVSVMYMSFYPQYRDDPDLAGSVESGVTTALGMTDFASGAGYMQATIYSILIPLLLLIFAIGFGARAIAGEEETGTLDLYLAHPISKRKLVLERFGALCAVVFGFGVLVWADVSLLARALDMGVGLDRVAAASLGLALLAICFGTLALAVGGATGQRGLTLGITAAVAVFSYLLNMLAPQLDAIGGLTRLSPFHYYLDGDPLRTGFNWLHISVLVAIPLALLAVTLTMFGRRDINV